jgi:hypothetical protein
MEGRACEQTIRAAYSTRRARPFAASRAADTSKPRLLSRGLLGYATVQSGTRLLASRANVLPTSSGLIGNESKKLNSTNKQSKEVSYPRNSPWRPTGFSDAKDDSRLTDDDQVVSLKRGQKHYFSASGTRFC